MRLLCHVFVIKIEVIPWAAMLEEVILSSHALPACCFIAKIRCSLQFFVEKIAQNKRQNKLKRSKAKINVHSCSVIKFPILCRPKRSSVTDRWEHHNLRQAGRRSQTEFIGALKTHDIFFSMVPICHLVLQLAFLLQLETTFIRITKWLMVAIWENCDLVSAVKTFAFAPWPRK